MQILLKAQATTANQTSMMLDKLSKRGERVAKRLHDAFMATGNEDLAGLFEPFIKTTYAGKINYNIFAQKRFAPLAL